MSEKVQPRSNIQIYNDYVNRNPQCLMLKPAVVWAQMYKQKVITKEQYDAGFNNNIIFPFSKNSQNSRDLSATEAFGGSFSTNLIVPKTSTRKPKLDTNAKNIRLSKDLYKTLSETNIFGFSSINIKQLKSQLASIKNPEDAEIVCSNFDKKVPEGLFYAIDNASINNSDKMACLKTLAKVLPPQRLNHSIARALYDDIHGIGSGRLEDHLEFLNSSNVGAIIAEYTNIPYYLHIENQLKNGVKEENLDVENHKKENIEGLLSAIDGEWGLLGKRKEIIQNIKNLALKGLSPYQTKRIKQDIAQHNNLRKTEVDLMRANNIKMSEYTLTDLYQTDPEMVIDSPKTKHKVQQTATGNCWLLSSFVSSNCSPVLRDMLNSQIKKDAKTGNYILHLKGPNKKYIVRPNEIENSKIFSSGNLNAKIVNIAMDKYIRDLAYKKNDLTYSVSYDEPMSPASFGSIDKSVDLNGNEESFFFKTLFGKDVAVSTLNSQVAKTYDFNNRNSAFTFSTTGENFKMDFAPNIIDINNTLETYELPEGHALGITSCDEKYIYFKDTHYPDAELRISRQDIIKLGVKITVAQKAHK